MDAYLAKVKHNKGLVPWLIRRITGSETDHVAVYIVNPPKFHENNWGVDAHSFDQWQENINYELVMHTFTISQEDVDTFKNEKYSNWHNFKTILCQFKFLRRFIKPIKNRSNCVGYACKVLGLPEEMQFLYPHQLVKEIENGLT
jgi:hypothetical protein